MKTIVCHGDSLTEGADLNPNYTWPLLVENQVKVKIINGCQIPQIHLLSCLNQTTGIP